MRARHVVLVVLGTLALAGCGGTAAPPKAATSSSAGEAAAVWQEFARCARTHGLPNLPDPRLDQEGEADFGAANGSLKQALAKGSALNQACGAILARLPASAKAQRPPTPAQFQQLLALAKCMREHGLADWPDPRADGTFVLPPRLRQLGKDGVRAQLTACRQFNNAAGKINAGD
jgi:hypothetical protein